MEIGSFKPRAVVRIPVTPFKPTENLDKPFIIKVESFSEGIKTKFSEDDTDLRSVVTCDIVDLVADKVLTNVQLWCKTDKGSALVDTLAAYVGKDAIAVKLAWQNTKPGKQYDKYVAVFGLDGDESKLAAAWVETNPTRVEDQRAEITKAAGATETYAGNVAEVPQTPKATNIADAIAALKAA